MFNYNDLQTYQLSFLPNKCLNHFLRYNDARNTLGKKRDVEIIYANKD